MVVYIDCPLKSQHPLEVSGVLAAVLAPPQMFSRTMIPSPRAAGLRSCLIYWENFEWSSVCGSSERGP